MIRIRVAFTIPIKHFHSAAFLMAKDLFEHILGMIDAIQIEWDFPNGEPPKPNGDDEGSTHTS